MTLDLSSYERGARDAVRTFWKSREAAQARQARGGSADQAGRAAVTAGGNMDGFIDLAANLATDNGLSRVSVHRERALLTLPGYFRPTKLWDLLLMSEGRLVAAIEFKSQVGPSFGNNFNNRAEEAIGSAHDLWTAYREGAFGPQSRPFLAWVILVEDAPSSRRAVACRSPHFSVSQVFEGASYLARYDLLCRRLVREGLYAAAAVVASPKSAARTGAHSRQSEYTDLRIFAASLAGHVAAEAAKRRTP